MKLKDIMTKDVSTASPEASVQEVARKMRELNVGAIPIVEEGRPVGIITDRDIVLRNVVENKEAKSVRVFEIMTRDLVLGEPEMDVREAAVIMSRHQIRRLPVVENGRLVGIVSIGDLATRSEFADEAGEALSDISVPSRPQLQ